LQHSCLLATVARQVASSRPQQGLGLPSVRNVFFSNLAELLNFVNTNSRFGRNFLFSEGQKG